jgi:putative oxidoreductase
MTLASATHALFRIGVALLFMAHGLQKLFGLFGGRQVALGSLMGAAGVIELVGGLLLLLGLWVRPVAVLAALEMVSAFAIAHAPKGGLPLENGGELALLYALAFVFLAGNGAGPLSLDAALRRRDARLDADDVRLRRAA